MAFDINAGLQAFANAGTGYMQGVEHAQDRQYQQRARALAMQESDMDYQQKKLDFQRAQQLSDYSMQMFNPSLAGVGATGQQPGQPPAGGQDPNSPQGQGAALASNGQPFNLIDYNTKMAERAASIGDISRAEQFGTNAINASNDQALRQQRDATMQLTNLKARAQEMQTVSQLFQGVHDQASYDRARAQLMSDPSIPPASRQGIAQFPEQYNPAFVDHVVQMGMSTYQSTMAQLRQQEVQQRQRIDQARLTNDNIRTDLARQKEVAYEKHLTSQTKAGAVSKFPTDSQIAFATQATKDAMGPDVDVESDAFKAARQSIASRAQQLLKDNRSLDANQAVNMAAQEAKDSGEFGTMPGEDKRLDLGLFKIGSAPKPVQTFKDKGDTAAAPIEIHKGVTKDSDLINGKYYTFGGKTYLAQDGRLKPVQ